MNQGQPAFGLSFDPRALGDLLQAPSDIRDLTLAYLQDVVNADRFGIRLTGDLEGYRKLFVDARRDWRVVYGIRPAPETSAYAREVYVVAVRPRAGNDVYDEVGRRLGMSRRPLSARTHAARSRSPQLAIRHPVSRRIPLPSAMPGLPRPALSPSPLHTR
ncbi:hypothetical protein QR97_31770 [Streptomyces sp. PBH53]|uniref:hypothetical protein n=1 Tax=Streptomyces sp. PBH53 TaxID=1577075 RepID=UPI0006560A28|nr:hypothetical protein [Streptomyces sp. PBH53]AKN73711.1 hypothetical protein QR97_31770 [Streptomyces sp. PBH53]